jgi:class 3 adenylate cyclase
MKIGIGMSLAQDPKKAAAEAVAQAKAAVPRPGLALAFASIHMDQPGLHGALCRELDGTRLMGGSCYAHLTNAGVSKDGLAVLLLDLDGAQARFSSQDIGADLRETGRALARGLPPGSASRPLALAFSGITTGREHEMLLGINDVVGPAPIFGGLCCGDYDLGMSHPDFWTNYQYAGTRLTRKTARLALLDLPADAFKASFGFAHGWQPVGPAVELSSCADGKVYEVGGVPIFDYYRQFLGRGQSDDFFELMVQRYGFSLLLDDGKRSRVKLPVACDFKGGCISYFPVEDLQGRQAQLILASRNGLLSGAREAAEGCLRGLGGERPDFVFVVSCCSRSAILHSRTARELDEIQAVFGKDVPVFGYYSGGEFGPCLSRYEDVVDPSQPLAGSQYHTTTVCIMALKGAGKAQASVPAPLRQEREPERLRELLAKGEQIHDDTERFLANLSRKSYLDGEQLRKQNEVIHRYTPHQVWAKVGASVAAGQYELPDSEFNGCFLFMDVKGFTAYSEEHGPSEVVAALNGIFKPATETIYACGGDVDKFIGDCIFAVFASPDDALAAGRRLLELFAGLQAEGGPFAVRIGINSGRAVRANVGAPDRREYTFIGDAVNTAQRLESACTPGKLLVCEELCRRAAGKFASAERREVKAKGKKNAVVAYELSL